MKEDRSMKKTPPKKIITGDPFLDSLHTLAPSDIDSKIPKKKMGSYVGPVMRIGILLLCVAVLVTSLLSIAGSLADYKTANDYYGQLAGMWGDNVDGKTNPFGPLELAYKNNIDHGTPLYGMAVQNPDNAPEVEIGQGDSAEMLQLRAKLNALKTQH